MNIVDAQFKNLPEETLKGSDVFGGKRVVVFGLPGAFTPTCSSKQLPRFDELYNEFTEYVDEVYCVSVNDGFVMKAWFENLGIENVKYLSDGSGVFTKAMGMLVAKDNLGFGFRSWRYAVVLNDGNVERMFAEEGFCDNCETDPYEVSTPENVLEFLKS